jgi:hypothetical protein
MSMIAAIASASGLLLNTLGYIEINGSECLAELSRHCRLYRRR